MASQQDFISWYVDSKKVEFKKPEAIFELIEFPQLVQKKVERELSSAIRVFYDEKKEHFEVETTDLDAFCKIIVIALRKKYFFPREKTGNWYLEWISGKEDYDSNESHHSLNLTVSEFSETGKQKAKELAKTEFTKVKNSKDNYSARDPQLVWKEDLKND